MISKLLLNKDFKELVLHSKNYLSAEFLSLLIGFLALPFYTRILSPADFGVMSVFVSFVTMFSVILGLGIRGAIVRYYYEDKGDFYDFFNTNITLSIIVGFTLIVFFFFFKEQIQSFFEIPIELLYYGIVISFFTVFIQLYQAYLQASKQSKILSFQKILQVSIGVGFSLVIMCFLTSEKYYGRSYAMLLAVVVLSSIIFYNTKNFFKFSLNKKHITYSLAFGLPILLHLISQNILSTFDQVMINNLLGEKETGLYSIAYRIGMIQNSIAAATLAAWTPIFYKKLNLNKFEDLKKLTKKYIFIITFLAIGLILFSKETLYVFADRRYYEALSVIPIVIIGYFFFFLYSIYVSYSFYEKKTIFISITTIFVGVINITLNFWLIPFYGYIGAAWSTLCSYLLLFLLHYGNCFLKYKKYNFLKFNVFFIPLSIIFIVFLINNYIIFLDLNCIQEVLIKILILSLMLSIYFVFKKYIYG
ncbi:flippase [uncultured Polaribacter sp.]|uniref:flippase n=1 Tax=uncultured Polaribacter sp. TaxID=174711 RepID=UPI00263573F0|nr:flippase [uncultured Polaribacter sp.]